CRVRTHGSGRALSCGERRRSGARAVAGPAVPLPWLERVRELRLPCHAGGEQRLLLAGLQRRGSELPRRTRLRAARAEPGVPGRHEGAADPRPVPAIVWPARLELVLRTLAVR